MAIDRAEVDFVRKFLDSLRFLEVDSFDIATSRFNSGVENMAGKVRELFNKEESEMISLLFISKPISGDYSRMVNGILQQLPYQRMSLDGYRFEKLTLERSLIQENPGNRYVEAAIAFCEGAGVDYEEKSVA